jgi:hypothetical protein
MDQFWFYGKRRMGDQGGNGGHQSSRLELALLGLAFMYYQFVILTIKSRN